MKSTYFSAFQYVKSKSVSRNYPTFSLNKQEDDVFISTLKFLERFQPETAILICQRSESPSLQYASENFKHLLGYDAAMMMRLSFMDYLDLIHPDDIDAVLQCFTFINSYEPYDPLQYRFELYYRIKNAAGHYIAFCEEKMCLSNTDGKYIYLNACRNVSGRDKFHDVKVHIHQCLLGEFKKIYTYNPRQNSSLTPRQKDIANLISKGLNNQEIADHLHVSVNTVKNHKNSLFKKANVKTSIELLTIAQRHPDFQNIPGPT